MSVIVRLERESKYVRMMSVIVMRARESAREDDDCGVREHAW